MCFHPSGTRVLAEQTLVERLHRELAADAPVDASRALVRQLAIASVPPSWRTDGDARWQWRVVLRATQLDAGDSDHTTRRVIVRETMQHDHRLSVDDTADDAVHR